LSSKLIGHGERRNVLDEFTFAKLAKDIICPVTEISGADVNA